MAYYQDNSLSVSCSRPSMRLNFCTPDQKKWDLESISEIYCWCLPPLKSPPWFQKRNFRVHKEEGYTQKRPKRANFFTFCTFLAVSGHFQPREGALHHFFCINSPSFGWKKTHTKVGESFIAPLSVKITPKRLCVPLLAISGRFLPCERALHHFFVSTILHLGAKKITKKVWEEFIAPFSVKITLKWPCVRCLLCARNCFWAIFTLSVGSESFSCDNNPSTRW